MRPGKKFTYGLLPSLLCLFAALLAACGGTPTPPDSKGPTRAAANQQIAILPESGVSDIPTFDPGFAADVSSIAAIDLVFTGLVQLDDNLKVQPQLAASYSEGADGLTWTFHLRPKLKFSDGTALTYSCSY